MPAQTVGIARMATKRCPITWAQLRDVVLLSNFPGSDYDKVRGRSRVAVFKRQAMFVFIHDLAGISRSIIRLKIVFPHGMVLRAC